jgi:hypothetical protein
VAPTTPTGSKAWRHATRLANYLHAVRAQVDTLPAGQAKTEAKEWLTWAEAHVERLNPLSSPPRLPRIPEANADDLRAFLRGFSLFFMVCGL